MILSRNILSKLVCLAKQRRRMWNDFYRMCDPRKKLSGTTNLFHPTVNPAFNPLMKPRVSSMEEPFLLWKRPSLRDQQPCDTEEGLAPLWLESKKSSDDSSSEPLPLPHSTKGLLIHRKLDVSPTFGITTRSDAGTYVSDFDRDNLAFGVVLEGMDFLEYCSELPTYSVERPSQDEESLVQDAAKAVFDAQRDFFRGAAKSLGDTRVSKLVPGKILRRVEVTRVAIL